MDIDKHVTGEEEAEVEEDLHGEHVHKATASDAHHTVVGKGHTPAEAEEAAEEKLHDKRHHEHLDHH